MKHVALNPVSLKNHPSVNEMWVQDLIAEEPSMLGIGDVVLRDRERKQPHAGRLDLLLQDSDSGRRYEVELQLGDTDESHIIRTIEYWDLERKRYPQYEHCAVLIAEHVTGRFLNVVSLFNGFIPIMALQMTAYKVDDGLALTFTRVIDEMPLGPVDEDEVEEPTDRSYWEKKGTKATMGLMDNLLHLIGEIAPGYEPKYNKFYVGLSKDGTTNNFAIFKPRRKSVLVEVRLPKSETVSQGIEDSGLEALDYTKWGRYRFRVSPDELEPNREFLRGLFKQAEAIAR